MVITLKSDSETIKEVSFDIDNHAHCNDFVRTLFLIALSGTYAPTNVINSFIDIAHEQAELIDYNLD